MPESSEMYPMEEKVEPSSDPGKKTTTTSEDGEEIQVEGTHHSTTSESNIDPFDVDDIHWSFEKTLVAAIQNSEREGNGPIIPHMSLAFKDIEVYGQDTGIVTQADAGSLFINLLRLLFRPRKKRSEKQILHGIDGLVREGEMLLTLGGPGSGCTTLLKMFCGHREGYERWDGQVCYSGIPLDEMLPKYRGSIIYNGEVDHHFSHLTVAQTLDFAARTKTPHRRIGGMSRKTYVQMARNALVSIFGLTRNIHTKVGNDFVRGLSGGEKRRLAIAEALVMRASVTCWDNPTRGLDSAMSIEFAQALRLLTRVTKSLSICALYQPGQSLAAMYDNVLLLHQGHQIWFGTLEDAKEHFQQLGFECSPRQTTAEFLVSITDSNTVHVRHGFEHRVPRTPEEFRASWIGSARFQQLQAEIEQHEAKHTSTCSGELDRLANVQAIEKVPSNRTDSSYIVSLWTQFTATFIRACQRIRGEYIYYMALSVVMLVAPMLIGSMFYNIPTNTNGFTSKGGVIFVVILFSIIVNFAEVILQFQQRAITEKHKSYAMYHPAVDSIATMLSQYPLKILNVAVFSAIAYFIAGLKREAGPFFIFVLFLFITTITITSYFRTVASMAATVETALAISGLTIIPMMVYSGYIIPRPSMHPWFKWISYINPVYYVNEALMAVEFHNRKAPCAGLIPSGPLYDGIGSSNQVCPVVGAQAGTPYVLGDSYIGLSSGYQYDHVWRNLGICVSFFAFFTCTYALATEFNRLKGPASSYMVFRKSTAGSKADPHSDLEAGSPSPKPKPDMSRNHLAVSQSEEEVFSWTGVDYTIEVNGHSRPLLQDVQGYIEPGTLTALMGASGAGKTTLLNVLAQRVHVGVLSGATTVAGIPCDASFNRRTGYVQQQDVHIAEATVREAFRFSALLRQPHETPISEKYAYVEEIISVLGLEEYADAVIGIPGKGLSAEKRKRVTIGIELVAKPSLLLFLDEPTSGLDSQSAYSIVKLIRGLANAGQAILCTIHQPSSDLFEQFDKVLLLDKGKTVYFGDTGKNSQQILNYFERNGAAKCAMNHNPAEYILDVVGAGPTSSTTQDWADTWEQSVERRSLSTKTQILQSKKPTSSDGVRNVTISYATPWTTQFLAVQKRLFQQNWRSPTYVNSKLFINVVGGLFIGFTFFDEGHLIQSLQNKIFSIFMMLLLCLVLIFLLQPRLVALRAIYDVRERYSNMYHWTVFVTANILVEIPFNFVTSSLGFICWFFPGGWWRKISTGSCIYMWFLYSIYQIYQTSFSQVIAMASPNAETAIMITVLFYAFIFIFSGILQPFKQLIGFWHFAYYVSPFTWIVSSMMSVGTHGVAVRCSATEVNIFQPPAGMTCGAYGGPFAQAIGAMIYNPVATESCQFCIYSVSDSYLNMLNMSYDDRWRNLGFVFGYTVFNICLFFLGFYFKSNVDFSIKRTVSNLRNMFFKK